jgi:plasmid stabilization system protein ParE
MTHAIVVLPEANRDADRIFEWIENQSREGAGRGYAAFLKTLESLKNNPDRCGRAPEAALVAAEIRQITFKTRRGGVYRILFLVCDDEVLILHVRGPGQPLLTPDELRGI